MPNSQLVLLHSLTSDSVLFSLLFLLVFQLTIVSITSESRANL